MAEYDLTFTIMKHIDRHMVLPVLEWLQEKRLYKDRDLRMAKLDLVSRTSMVDCAGDEYKVLHDTDKIPQEMEDQKTTVINQLASRAKACGPFISFEGKEPELTSVIIQELQDQGNFDAEFLANKHNVTWDNIKALYPYAKLNFDCGGYQVAAETLYYFRQLNTDAEKNFWALWGKLAAEILIVENGDTAREDLKELRDLVDSRVFTDHLEQLQQRTWLAHWGLFVFFNLENGLQDMIDFYFQDKMLNTVQTTSPHILRYVAIAVIASASRKPVMKDLIRTLILEKELYSDSVTEFLLAIYLDFDFKKAFSKLQECEELVKNDFFLAHLAGEQHIGETFIKCARQLLFETICTLYKRIDMSEIAGVLGLQESDDYLPKLVQMIRDARINAKVDAENLQLIMETNVRGVHQSIVDLDKDKGLAERTRKLMAQVEKKYSLLGEEQ